jgi:hypothetical protein
MTQISKKIRRFAIILVSAAVAGCGTSGPTQEAAPTSPDLNAVKIITHVKAEPSTITGGGMVYKLFVGGQFNAVYNDKARELKLTDLENKTTCSYDDKGMLTVPEDATKGYNAYCTNLATNTAQYLGDEAQTE